MTPLLAVFRWNHSGLVVDFGFYALRWYSLMWLAGFLIGFKIVRGFFQREDRPVKKLDDLLLVILAGALIGARLGNVLFYRFDYFLENPLQIFFIWEGGLASHGGMVGVLLAVWLYTRVHREFGYLWLLDRIVVPTALAGALIRVGNFFNSEILGRPTDVSWGVVFERFDDVARHPVMLYESAAYLAIYVLLRQLYLAWTPGATPGRLLGMFLSLVFAARFLLEPFKMRQATFAEEWLLSMGQWLSIVPVVAGLILLLRPAAREDTAGAKGPIL